MSRTGKARQVAVTDDGADEVMMQRALIALPIVTIAGATAGGYFMGPPVVVLVLAAGVLLAAIAGFWNSIRALFGQTALSREDAFALGAPSAEEEQKRAVLRAIKDLEFEHGVGKISDADYLDLLGQYRARAKKLLRVIDDAALPERNKVEALVEAHLKEQGIAVSSAKWPDDDSAKKPATKGASDKESDDTGKPSLPAQDEDSDEEGAMGKRSLPVQDEDSDDEADAHCEVCSTANDTDAVFCKKCGARLNDDDDDDDDDDKEENA